MQQPIALNGAKRWPLSLDEQAINYRFSGTT
jgi:hypothetical protein